MNQVYIPRLGMNRFSFSAGGKCDIHMLSVCNPLNLRESSLPRNIVKYQTHSGLKAWVNSWISSSTRSSILSFRVTIGESILKFAYSR